MFAPLKRIIVLTAAALLIPGIAFSNVHIVSMSPDNPVNVDSQGFVVSIQAQVGFGDDWSQTEFVWQDDNGAVYTDICLDHDTLGPGNHVLSFLVPFENSEMASVDDHFEIYTYDEATNGSSCNTDNGGYWFGDDSWIDITQERLPEIIQFGVNKQFRPVSDENIQVDINCTAGSPGDDSAIMDQDGVHIFPQEFLNPANPNHNCVVTESDSPAGYEALYVANIGVWDAGFGVPGNVGGFGTGVASTEGCFFYGSANMRGNNHCMILNLGLPSTFTITKDWEINQDSDTPFVTLEEQFVSIQASCSTDILAMHISDEGDCMDDDADSDYNGCTVYKKDLDLPTNDWAQWHTIGDAEVTFTVANNYYEAAVCEGYEYLRYSNTETVSTTCWEYDPGPTAIQFELTPGGSDGCGFVNTVFFEGIPTLSQYGMAIMALLMLGVGFVGFRRFV